MKMKKSRINNLICKLIIFIFIVFILSLVLSSSVYSESINWNNVDYVQPKKGQKIYVSETGTEQLETGFIFKSKQTTKMQIYDVLEVGDERIKIQVSSSAEGWIAKTAVDFYQGQEIQFESWGGNAGSEATIVKGTLVGKISSTNWSVEDENNSDISKNQGIKVENIHKLSTSIDEIGDETGLDGDKLEEETNKKNEEEKIILNNGYENEADKKEISEMTDDELEALYNRIADYERNYGDQNSDVEDKKIEVANELGKRGYDSMDLEDTAVSGIDTIYTQPSKNGPNGSGDSLDDIFTDAEELIDISQPTIDETNLQNFSNVVYNILLSVGIVVAVIVGALIGVKLMASNIETKVEAKKLLIPYVVGCIVVFGAFGIWKIVVTILQGM